MQRATSADVVLPALGVLKRLTGTDGAEYVEIQTDPFPIREVIAGLGGGLPTFYLVFPDGTGLGPLNGQIAPAAEVLRAAAEVTIALVFQDRVTRDPALWASQILAAMAAVQGNTTLWQPFADAVVAQTASGNRAPVLLLDQTGEPSAAAKWISCSGPASPGELRSRLRTSATCSERCSGSIRRTPDSGRVGRRRSGFGR